MGLGWVRARVRVKGRGRLRPRVRPSTRFITGTVPSESVDSA